MRKLSLRGSPYYHFMEEDDNFRRWVESLERGSRRTGGLRSSLSLRTIPMEMPCTARKRNTLDMCS